MVSLVSCNHQHTYPCVQATPALVPFVGELPFGMAPGGGICPSRRQQLPLGEQGVILGTFFSLVDLAVLGLRLDLMILKVFSNLNDSLIL